MFIEPFSFSFLSITGWGIDLDYCVLNVLPWKRTEIILSFFETASKQCISDSVVDYDGCSVSSKGFFPTVIDIMFILNSPIPVLFSFQILKMSLFT